LLFSDIEGSTALLHRLGERWGEALSAQRSLLRRAFESHGGTEMGTEGDSFFVVFRSAHEAIRAAVEGQRALQSHDWPNGVDVRVRMGLHTGEPQRHEDGYIGEDVHRAARIGSTAHGGQTVLSQATRALVEDLTAELEIRDLGRHRLKDLAGDERLYDVVGPGLLGDFPPLRSLGKRAALPTSTTPLIGRQAETAAVLAAFREPGARLVTLTGPGGAGKTRLATAAAAELDDASSDGVYFVPLHAVDRGERMWSGIAEALDVGPGNPVDKVVSHLAERSVLLVLDNLEQIPDADVVVSQLLSGAPRVKVLATSRRPLLLVGERELPTPPLELPPPEAPSSAADDATPAVQMFLRHAQLVRPSFRLTADNRADVIAVCRRLDGLPLAIELAAASSRLLTPRALLSRIDNRLGSGLTAADRPERQRTLGATIAWSYDLLAEEDRRVFRRLGVFHGSCDLDAIEEVAGEPGLETIDVVTRLVSTSLVRVDEGADGEPRIALLETIRRFARDLLTACAEADEVRHRHLRWCTAVADRATSQMRGPLHPVALDTIALVEADVRGALDWSLRPAADPADPAELDRVQGGLELMAIATRYWYRFGSTAEARQWQERGLAIIDAEGDEGSGAGQDEARSTLLHGLGVSTLQHGERQHAVELFERSLRMSRAIGRQDLEARALNDLAIAARQQGDYERSMELFEQCRDTARAAGSLTFEATALGNMVVVLNDLGRYADAADMALASMEVNLRNNDHWAIAVDRLNYVAAILRTDGPAVALARYDEWADEVASFRDKELGLDLCEVGAAIAAGLDRPELAARLAASADSHRTSIPMPRSAAEQAMVDGYLAPARAALSDADWAAAYRTGAGLSVEEAVALVRAIRQPAAAMDAER
jgi:predicted ATPase/class 3 adenylate cyclase